MSEEATTQVEEKIDFNKIIEDKINPVLQSINQTKAELTQKLDSVKQTKEPKKSKKEVWDFLNDEEEDEDLTQDVKKNTKEMDREFEKKIDRKLKIERDRNTFDSLAYQSFPELKEATSKFSQAVRQEMESMAQDMIDYYGLDKATMEIMAEDPKIFYTAASRVAANKPDLRDKNLINQQAADMYKGTNVGSTIKPVKREGELDEQTKQLAKRFGLSVEDVKKYMKK